MTGQLLLILFALLNRQQLKIVPQERHSRIAQRADRQDGVRVRKSGTRVQVHSTEMHVMVLVHVQRITYRKGAILQAEPDVLLQPGAVPVRNLVPRAPELNPVHIRSVMVLDRVPILLQKQEGVML